MDNKLKIKVWDEFDRPIASIRIKDIKELAEKVDAMLSKKLR